MAVIESRRVHRSRRRGQRGVVSTEVALAFPVLILIVGSAISIGRLAHVNIRLDSVAAIALHDCVLDPDGTDPETVAECVQGVLDNGALPACAETEVTVTFEDVTRNRVDPDTGELLETIVPMAQADVTCLVSTFGEQPRGQRASWVPDTELESTVTASRN